MKTFKEIYGHQEVVDHIRTAVRQNKISHAYIIQGDKGIGKKTLVNAFVKLLQCQQPVDSDGCGQCHSCQLLDSGNHPDVIYARPTKKTGYGVDDIRDQVIKDVAIKPYQADYKVYIIDQADTMSPQGQNALLKTIEDPPSYGLFFLICKNSKELLQTIQSRCVILPLHPLKAQQVEDYLQENSIHTSLSKEVLTAYSRGNIGKAIELAESNEFLAMREDMINLLEVFINQGEYDIINSVYLLEKHKANIQEVLDILRTLIRDCLVLIHTGEKKHLIHQDLIGKISHLSYRNKEGILFQLNRNISIAVDQLHANVNFELTQLMMLLNIKETI